MDGDWSKTSIALDGSKIRQAGWNFFYIAGVIETNAFGSDEKKTTRKAVADHREPEIEEL